MTDSHGHGGDRLRTRSWAAAGTPAGHVLLVHGLAEHSGRYESTGRQLAAAGFDVRAFDLPGFGESDGRRAYVERWDDYLEVVAAQLGGLGSEARSPRPEVLLGHSMGALIALTYVLTADASSRPLPDLLVLSAPPLGRPPLPAATRLAAPVLARLVPTLEISNGLLREQLSRDPSVGESYAADPLVHPRTTARLGHELFKAMSRADVEVARRDRLPVPTLVLHGEEDAIASPAMCGSLRAVGNCEYRLLPGLRHEILNEPEGPQVVGQIVEWIRSTAEAWPSPTPPAPASASIAAGR